MASKLTTFTFTNHIESFFIKTRSRSRFKRLRTEPRIRRTLKLLHQKCFLVMPRCSKNFRELR